jgi:hypothetical protein
MAETTLKLVKNQKKQPPPISKAAEKKIVVSRLSPLAAILSLTPAERAEAARFRALTADKAARQAMVHQIMAELQELDEIESAA